MKRLIRKASMSLYHGTSDIYMDSIKSVGLVPGVDTGNSSSPNSDNSFVYLTNSSKEAKEFAEYTASQVGGNPVLLEVNIDSSLLVPDENTFLHDIVDFDKAMQLCEVDEEGMDYIWGFKRGDNKQYYVFLNGMFDDDPIEYNPGEKPFVGEDIFNVLNQDLAKYPQSITPDQITNIKVFDKVLK